MQWFRRYGQKWPVVGLWQDKNCNFSSSSCGNAELEVLNFSKRLPPVYGASRRVDGVCSWRRYRRKKAGALPAKLRQLVYAAVAVFSITDLFGGCSVGGGSAIASIGAFHVSYRLRAVALQAPFSRTRSSSMLMLAFPRCLSPFSASRTTNVFRCAKIRSSDQEFRRFLGNAGDISASAACNAGTALVATSVSSLHADAQRTFRHATDSTAGIQFESVYRADCASSFNSSTHEQSNWQNVFCLDLPEGKCLGIRLISSYTSLSPDAIQSNPHHWIRKHLHPHEVQFGVSLPSTSARASFFVGRLAMRTALNISFDTAPTMPPANTSLPNSLLDDNDWKPLFDITEQEPSILKDEHGRPTVPRGFLGSISHKQEIGVALVSADYERLTPTCGDNSACYGTEAKVGRPKRGIGIDIEQTFSKRKDIARKILTENELEELGRIKGVTAEEEVLLRFSLKESVYKAIHPIICQWVGFQEAEITPHQNGTATVVLNLKSGAQRTISEITAHWRRLDESFFLTSSSATAVDNLPFKNNTAKA